MILKRISGPLVLTLICASNPMRQPFGKDTSSTILENE